MNANAFGLTPQDLDHAISNLPRGEVYTSNELSTAVGELLQVPARTVSTGVFCGAVREAAERCCTDSALLSSRVRFGHEVCQLWITPYAYNSATLL